MKGILLFCFTLLTIHCFGAGATVSSFNGQATNLNLNGTTVTPFGNLNSASTLSSNAVVAGNPNSFNGLSVVGRGTQNPAIPHGSAGTWNAGETRDPSVWYDSDGNYYCFYIGHDSGSANAKIGIRVSSDGGNTWKEGAASPLLTTNPVANTWWSGNLISPYVLRNPVTNEKWVFIGGTTNNSSLAYQLGTYNIGVMYLASGLSPTNPASYIWVNSTNTIFTITQPWENTNFYAPCAVWANTNDLANNTCMILYNSLTNGNRQTGGGTIVLPTSPTTTSAITVTKFSSNPLIATRSLQTEEPCLMPLIGGGWIDISAGDVFVAQAGFPISWTAVQSLQSNWVTSTILSIANPLPNLADSQGYVGSASVCQKPDGNWLMMFTVSTNSSNGIDVICSVTLRQEVAHNSIANVDRLQVNNSFQFGTPTDAGDATGITGNNSQDAMNTYTNRGWILHPTFFSDNVNALPSGFSPNTDFEIASSNGVREIVGQANPTIRNQAKHYFGQGGGGTDFGIEFNLFGDNAIHFFDDYGAIYLESGNGGTRVTNIVLNTDGSTTFRGLVTFTNSTAFLSNSISVAVTVGASPFLFTNKTTTTLRCDLSDSTAITASLGRNGVTIFPSTTDLNTETILGINEYLTVTYSGGTPVLYTNK